MTQLREGQRVQHCYIKQLREGQRVQHCYIKQDEVLWRKGTIVRCAASAQRSEKRYSYIYHADGDDSCGAWYGTRWTMMLLCKNCDMPRHEHADHKKCLYGPGYWEE